jgi:monofunctional biosynthetic peptidoglycan transglycosylase
VELQGGRPGSWVGLKGVSKRAVWAILVSEDWAFYEHEGLDWDQIEAAAETNWKRGRFARGASTISQQVVKNVFLTREKTLTRKFAELILTIWMEREVSKSRILETYLNIAEWGEGIYGIGAAARHYFGKAPSELTAREGAYLAMLLPSPIRYSRSFRRGGLSAGAMRTIENILQKLVQARVLSEEERIVESQTRFPFETGAVSGETED